MSRPTSMRSKFLLDNLTRISTPSAEVRPAALGASASPRLSIRSLDGGELALKGQTSPSTLVTDTGDTLH
jgi:hypothetical protein